MGLFISIQFVFKTFFGKIPMSNAKCQIKSQAPMSNQIHPDKTFRPPDDSSD
jgi:hypothetical protein